MTVPYIPPEIIRQVIEQAQPLRDSNSYKSRTQRREIFQQLSRLSGPWYQYSLEEYQRWLIIDQSPIRPAEFICEPSTQFSNPSRVRFVIVQKANRSGKRLREILAQCEGMCELWINGTSRDHTPDNLKENNLDLFLFSFLTTFKRKCYPSKNCLHELLSLYRPCRTLLSSSTWSPTWCFFAARSQTAIPPPSQHSRFGVWVRLYISQCKSLALFNQLEFN